MTGRDIADALAAAQDSSAGEARARVAFLLESMADGIAQGDIALAGFGRLATTRSGTRKVRIAQHREVVVIGFWTRTSPGPDRL